MNGKLGFTVVDKAAAAAAAAETEGYAQSYKQHLQQYESWSKYCSNDHILQ